MYTNLEPVTHHFYPLQEHIPENVTAYKTFLDVLNNGTTKTSDSLIYLHIPYCEKHCLFCPFHIRVQKNDQIYRDYVNAMLKEIEMLSEKKYIQNMIFNAIYFGGGSPSLLPVELVQTLYDSLRKNFNIKKDAEWTFEGEPHGLSNVELLSYLASQNTRRISYGVQTFDPALREKLHIAASVEDVINCLELARQHHIPEINIDMMFHLPGHNINDLENDIQQIERYGFDSVDYYYLSYYGFPKKILHDMEKGLFPAKPSIELRFEMNRYVRNRMLQLGYSHVTDHVFSKSSLSSEYYRILWGGGFGEHQAETLAIGSSARGYLDGISYANNLRHNEYIQEVLNGQLPIFKISERLQEPENRGLVFFPKFFKIDKRYVMPGTLAEKVFNKLISYGYVKENSSYYEITDSGKDWIPNITLDFFEEHQIDINNRWVSEINQKHSNRVTR